MFYIIGLGNPGEEYENTRHNTGRMILRAFSKTNDFPEFVPDKRLNALVSKGSVSRSSVKGQISLVLPETFMNKSGEAVMKIEDLKFKVFGKGKDKKTEVVNLIVVHDDLDIPFGKLKISFNKSSGGHRGVESIIKLLKTQAFTRVRVGISKTGPRSIIKKPKGEEAVNKYILGKFTEAELADLKKISIIFSKTISIFTTEGREIAVSQYNQNI